MSAVIGLAEAKAKLSQLEPKQMRAVERASILAAGRVLAKAMQQKTRSQRTKQKGIQVRVTVSNDKSEVDVGVNRYGMFEELGTRAHVIRARAQASSRTFKNKKGRTVTLARKASSPEAVLYFNGHFSPEVHHPGSAAHPFMRQALAESEPQIVQTYGERFKKRIEALTS